MKYFKQLPTDILAQLFYYLGSSERLNLNTLNRLNDAFALSLTCQHLHQFFLSSIISVDLRPYPNRLSDSAQLPIYYHQVSNGSPIALQRRLQYIIKNAPNLRSLHLCHKLHIDLDIYLIQNLQIEHLEIDASYFHLASAPQNKFIDTFDDQSSSHLPSGFSNNKVIVLPKTLSSLVITGLGTMGMRNLKIPSSLKSLTVREITQYSLSQVQDIIEQQSTSLSSLSLSFHTCFRCNWGRHSQKVTYGLISLLIKDLNRIAPNLEHFHFSLSAPVENAGYKEDGLVLAVLNVHETIQRLRKPFRLHPSLRIIHLQCEEKQISNCLAAILPVLSNGIRVQVSTQHVSIVSIDEPHSLSLLYDKISIDQDGTCPPPVKRMKLPASSRMRKTGCMEYRVLNIPVCIPKKIQRLINSQFPQDFLQNHLLSFSKLSGINISERLVAERLFYDQEYISGIKSMLTGFEAPGVNDRQSFISPLGTILVCCYFSFSSFKVELNVPEDIEQSELDGLNNVVNKQRPIRNRLEETQDACDIALQGVLGLLFTLHWPSLEINLPFDALISRHKIIRRIGLLDTSLHGMVLTSCFPSVRGEDDGLFGPMIITNEILIGLQVLLETLQIHCPKLTFIGVHHRPEDWFIVKRNCDTDTLFQNLLRSVDHIMACRRDVDVHGVRAIVHYWNQGAV